MNFNLDAVRSFAEQIGNRSGVSDTDLVIKVVGVSFENRQPLIEIMTEKTDIRLVRDRSNAFDFYAVSVEASIGGKWHSVGFIPKEMNRDIGEKLDKGIDVPAKILHFNEFFCNEAATTARGITIVIKGV